MEAIQFENLKFSYEADRPIIEIDQFRVSAGERVFLHGPSGSGKTTLLGLVTGVLVAESGVARVMGEDLSRQSASQRDRFRADRMGYIFQQFNLIPYLSALENILVPIWLSSERRRRIANSSAVTEAMLLADRLGLKDVLQMSILHLSVGQQQRVAVARALIGRPDLIVADEPTSALDDDRQQEFIDLLLERTQGGETSVLFVSHNKKLENHFDRSFSLSEINSVQKRPST